jgi:septal ring factor EnvC (AmiA/AmiB activator)
MYQIDDLERLHAQLGSAKSEISLLSYFWASPRARSEAKARVRDIKSRIKRLEGQEMQDQARHYISQLKAQRNN